jgi:hypothetical protein
MILVCSIVVFVMLILALEPHISKLTVHSGLSLRPFNNRSANPSIT